MFCCRLTVKHSNGFFKQKYFALSDVNEIFTSFKFSLIDKDNIPQVIKVNSLSSLRVKQTACEIHNLLRLYPVIIGSLVPKNDIVWTLIDFIQTIEHLTVSRVKKSDLMFLQDLLDKFLVKFVNVFPDDF